MKNARIAVRVSLAAALCGLLASPLAFAHGDVTPQAVDVKGLPPLSGPQTSNPYVGNAKAIDIGSHAFGQNCARCHGLGAVSGGIAPDLRYLPTDKATDEYFKMRVTNGAIRNGVTYMPAFGEVFNEQAIWAIRSYLVSIHKE